MKELNPTEDLSPNEILVNGKLLKSPKVIADGYREFIKAKADAIRNKVKNTNFKAVNTFKRLVK